MTGSEDLMPKVDVGTKAIGGTFKSKRMEKKNKS
jgi:hypothetical protein